MYILRLFHHSDPFTQIESRPLSDGALAVGREPDGGWRIPDPERRLSRLHCVLACSESGLTVRDESANGTLVGPARQPAPRSRELPIEPGETLRLGDYMILVERADEEAALRDAGFDAPFTRPMLQEVTVTPAALAAPADWTPRPGRAAEGETPAPLSDAKLLEAFCQGARLDPSAFAGDDPEETMRRLGAVYQQMVLGLADLMGERTSVKTEYRMSRTTVHAEGNNPLKWASAERVAIDLLRDGREGFLDGPEAVRASVTDLKTHLLCLLAGLRAAVGASLEALAPGQVEGRLEGRSFLLKTRGQAAWDEYGRMHADFRREAEADPDSAVNRAFRGAYERKLQELDGMEGA